MVDFEDEGWDELAGEHVSEALALPEAEGDKGHGVPVFAIGCFVEFVFGIESFWQEVVGLRPLDGVLVRTMNIKNQPSTRLDVIAPQLALLLKPELISKRQRHREPQALVYNLV